MTVEPRSPFDDIDERLASLEDSLLAERLFFENPSLYASPEEPPSTQREILAWATRRFGSVAIAVTAAVSIVAGYMLTPLVVDRATTHRAVETAPIAAPLVAVPPLAVPPAHRVVGQRAVPRHLAPKHVVPQHVASTVVVPRHALPRHAAASPRVAHVAHVATTTAPPAYAPVRHHVSAALRARLRAQDAEIARLRAVAAQEEAAANAAQARAAAAIAATHAQPLPQPQPRTGPATDSATGTATTTTTVPASATVPVDVPAPDPNAGAKTPPSNPNGGWSEHPPLPGPYGSIGPVPIGGTIDPCTPHGGRIGVVINAILQNTNLGAGLHF